MTRTRLVAGVLVLALIAAGCVGTPTDGSPPDPSRDGTAAAPGSTSGVAGGNGSDGAEIVVGAVGSTAADPDRAIVRVSVEATADDAATARRRLAENVSRVRAALREMGIEGDRITTAFFDIDRDRRHRPRRERGDGGAIVFEARHSLTIVLADTDRAGAVIVTAVENGATGVDDVEFTLSEETRRGLRHEAMAEAMDAARAEAETIAESAGSLDAGSLSVRSVRTTDVDLSFDRRAPMATPAPVAEAAPTSIDRGTVTVTARVTVVYNATGTT